MEALVKIGVTEVILALNYKAKEVCESFRSHTECLEMKITPVNELKPLSMIDYLILARNLLKDEKCFFFLNSDVICHYFLQKLLDFHRKNDAEAIILLTTIQPEKFGIFVHN
jgi:mannose-1-phosphate guanylyltransferase